MSPTIHAAGIVLMARTAPFSVLLLKHKNRWDLPKGHAEPGEQLRETALRETQEETGIAQAEIDLDPSFEFALEYEVFGKRRGAYHKRVTYFLGFVPQQLDVQLTEHIGYQWCDWPLGPLQAETIDPLFAAVEKHLGEP